MTVPTDKVLYAFSGKAVDALIEQGGSWNGHPIDGGCTAGLCSWCKGKEEFNSKGLLPLVAWFLEFGPEVSAGWTLTAKRDGFDAEALHEILLGIFVAGGKG